MGIVPVNIGGFIVDFYDGVGSIAQITGKHGRYLCSSEKPNKSTAVSPNCQVGDGDGQKMEVS